MKNKNQKILTVLISSSLLFSFPTTTYAMDLGSIFSVSTGQQIYGELGKALGAIFFHKKYEGNLMDNISAILKTEEKKNVKTACIKNISTCSDPNGMLTQEDWTEIYTRNNINPNNPFGYGQYAQNGQYGNNQQINNFPYPNQQNTQQTQPIQNGPFPTLNTQTQQTQGSSVIPQMPAGNPYSPEGQKQIQAAQQTQPTQIAGATTSAGLQYKLNPSKTCFTKVKPVLSPKAPLVGDEVNITLSTAGCDAQKAVLVVGDNKIAVTANSPILAEKEATEGTKQANFMVKDAKGNIIKGTFAYTVGAVGAVGSADIDETTYGGVDSTVAPASTQNENYKQRFNQSVANLGGEDTSVGNYDDGSYSSLSDSDAPASAEDNAYFENAIPVKNYPTPDNNTDRKSAFFDRFNAAKNKTNTVKETMNTENQNGDSVDNNNESNIREDGFFGWLSANRKKEEKQLEQQYLNSGEYNNGSPQMKKENTKAEEKRIFASRVVSDAVTGAATGCATGALFTSPTGPGALAGCVAGGVSGAVIGAGGAAVASYIGGDTMGIAVPRIDYITNNVASKETLFGAGLGLLGGAAGLLVKTRGLLQEGVESAEKALNTASRTEKSVQDAFGLSSKSEDVQQVWAAEAKTHEAQTVYQRAVSELEEYQQAGASKWEYFKENAQENISSIAETVSEKASSAWETFKSWF